MQPQRKASLTDEQIRHRQEQLRGFKRWVTHNVLPQIHQTGQYVPGTGNGRKVPTNFLEALKALVETEESRLKLQAQVQTLTPKADAYNRLLSGRTRRPWRKSPRRLEQDATDCLLSCVSRRYLCQTTYRISGISTEVASRFAK